MKKTIAKTIPAVKAQPAKTKEIILLMCDICGLEIKSYEKKCVLCERDVHGYNWTQKKQCMKEDERESGDYPDTYCIKCADLKFDKYDQEYRDMQSKAEKLEDDLEEKIKKESLENENA